MLGLFPEFGDGHIGGIQASARVAWEAIAANTSAELVRYSRSDNGTPAASNPRLQAMLATLKRRERPDIVLIWHIGLLKLLPFLRHDTRIVLFVHGIEAWKSHDWLTKRLAKKVDLFLTNSDYTWSRFIANNPYHSAANHRTVSLGIGEAVTTTPTAPLSTPVALMLARLSLDEDYKGHREVIAAWPQVLKEIPEAELWIAGDGDLKHQLEVLAVAQSCNGRIKFLGAVDDVRKNVLLEQSRCLLMPSRGEGFGLVYLEAMRLGRPSLVSDLDAGREVIAPDEAGLAVDPGNRDELARAVIRLLRTGSEWERWSEQSKRRYESNYTRSHFQERLLKALIPASIEQGSAAYV